MSAGIRRRARSSVPLTPTVEVNERGNEGQFVEHSQELPPAKELQGAAAILGAETGGGGVCGGDHGEVGSAEDDDTNLGSRKSELRAWARMEDDAIARLVCIHVFALRLFISGIPIDPPVQIYAYYSSNNRLDGMKDSRSTCSRKRDQSRSSR